jgi:hypothetical protein
MRDIYQRINFEANAEEVNELTDEIQQ